MSLAIGALLVALLLLPGIIFRYLYIRSDALRKTIDLSLLSEAVFILVPSLLLHLFGRAFVLHALGWEVNLEQLYRLSTNGADIDFEALSNGFPYFVTYILALCVAGGFIGIVFQRVVVKYGWDEQYKLLRIYNDWDKYISGEVLSRKDRDRLAFIQLAILVNSAEGDVLYTGVLANYSLNKEQGIDRIFLKHAFRRKFAADVPLEEGDGGPPQDYPVWRKKDYDERYYALPGDYFVIPFGEIRNLNIAFMMMEELPPDQALPRVQSKGEEQRTSGAPAIPPVETDGALDDDPATEQLAEDPPTV